MSSAAERRTPPPPRKRDAFRYGVRLVRTRLPNGEIEYLRTPMPKEALLHPQDEDYPVESDPHDIDRTYLRNTLSARMPRGWFLLSSCRVDWGVPGIEPHGPDISIFKGLRGKRKKWKTLYVAKEKVRPVAAIEITSASTRTNDLSIKVNEYYHAGVPLYAILDAREHGGVRQIRILGYKSNRRGYEKMELDARGRLLLEPLGVWLGAEGEHVCCWDAKTSERLEDYDSLLRDRQAAHQEAERACKAEVAAQEQIRRLQEEIKRLRSET